MTKTYRDLLAEARERVREVTTAEAEQAAAQSGLEHLKKEGLIHPGS